jgi:excisionase family DNA binding protein
MPKSKVPVDESSLLSISKAAKRIGISRASVSLLVRSGELRSVNVVKEQKYIRSTEIDEFIERRTIRAPEYHGWSKGKPPEYYGESKAESALIAPAARR